MTPAAAELAILHGKAIFITVQLAVLLLLNIAEHSSSTPVHLQILFSHKLELHSTELSMQYGAVQNSI
jgi:hypothetical protein